MNDILFMLIACSMLVLIVSPIPDIAAGMLMTIFAALAKVSIKSFGKIWNFMSRVNDFVTNDPVHDAEVAMMEKFLKKSPIEPVVEPVVEDTGPALTKFDIS